MELGNLRSIIDHIVDVIVRIETGEKQPMETKENLEFPKPTVAGVLHTGPEYITDITFTAHEQLAKLEEILF